MNETLINSNTFFDLNPTFLAKITDEPNILTDINNKAVKRPVALLQEICSKLTLDSPIYDNVDMIGPPHEPIFVFRVKNYFRFGIEDGKGTSKASAKHAAALEVLLLLKRMALFRLNRMNTKFTSDLDELIKKSKETNETKNDEKSMTTSNLLEDHIEDTTSNPVGELLEVTQRFLMRPPEFEFVDEEGPPHDKTFVCNVKCKLGQPEFMQQGRGKSKKIAKRQAALKLLNQIKSDPGLAKALEETNNKHGANGGHNSNNGCAASDGINNFKEKFHKKSLPHNLFTSLKTSTKSTISNLILCNSEYLHDLSLKNRLHELLMQLAAEEDFKFELFSFENLDNNDTIHTMLRVKKSHVYGGVGRTKADSINQAILNFFNAIKLNCLKQ